MNSLIVFAVILAVTPIILKLFVKGAKIYSKPTKAELDDFKNKVECLSLDRGFEKDSVRVNSHKKLF